MAKPITWLFMAGILHHTPFVQPQAPLLMLSLRKNACKWHTENCSFGELWTNPLGILVWNRQEPQNSFQSKAGGKFVEGGDISPRHKRKNLITSNVLLMSRFRARSNETLCVNFNLIYLQEPLNFRRTPKRGTPSWLLFRTNERARRGGASRRHRPRYGDLGAEQMRAYRALDISVNAMKTLLRVDQWGICHSWGPEPLWVY